MLFQNCCHFSSLCTRSSPVSTFLLRLLQHADVARLRWQARTIFDWCAIYAGRPSPARRRPCSSAFSLSFLSCRSSCRSRPNASFSCAKLKQQAGGFNFDPPNLSVQRETKLSSLCCYSVSFYPSFSLAYDACDYVYFIAYTYWLMQQNRAGTMNVYNTYIIKVYRVSRKVSQDPIR